MEDLANWYIKNSPDYDSLLTAVKSMIKSLLKREKIRYYHVQARVKLFDRFLEKMSEKKYSKPEEMTDLAGLRVVCYLRKDKEIVSGLLEDNIEVLKKEDKSLNLGVNRVGYNAIHLDAMLKQDRASLPEHEYYKEFKFEIQITTILQHTYAEISHGLIYKPDKILPDEIQSSIEDTSSKLDDLDDDYERIMGDIDKYREGTNGRVEKGQYNIPVDSPSLRLYLLKKFGDITDFKPQFGSVNDTDVIKDMHAMGIHTIAEFEKIIPENFVEKYREIPASGYGTFVTALVAWFLIKHDPKKYFKEVYKKSDGYFTLHDFRVLEKIGVDTSKLPLDRFDCK